MKNRYLSISVVLAVLAFISLAFQNCSKVDFQAKPQSSTDPATNVDPNGIDLVNEMFLVPTSNKKQVDILIVVDNSLSMEEEQSAMAARFNGFISTLQNLDWRLAITTTQTDSDSYDVSNCQMPGRDGCLLPFSSTYKWIDSSMNASLADSLFRNTVQMGADDTYTDERGIHAAYRFLQRYKNGNHNFFRQDSNVVIIIVSDEDERSIGWYPENDLPLEQTDMPQFLIDYYKQNLGPASFKAHGIITRPGDSHCYLSPNSNGRWPGDVYADLINRTDGVVGDVCASDYAGQLNEIGQTIVDQVNSKTLKCTPVDGDVVVYIKESSPSVGGSGSTYRRIEDVNVDLDYSVHGNIIRFGSPLTPGDELKFEFQCES